MSSGSRSKSSTRTPCYALSSAETVAENDDLLIQILSFLPIKALLRFKCVSKRWLSHVTDPNFSRRILSSRPLTVSGVFLCRGFRRSAAMEYEFLSLEDTDDDGDDEDSDRRSMAPPFGSRLRFADHPSDMLVLQSCNGLMLCKCSCLIHHNRNHYYHYNYYVYNPTTKQNTLLPPINDVSGISLAFDPSKLPRYNIVCLRTSDRSPELHQIEVYSSDAGPWRLSGSPFTLSSPVELGKTVFWNGAVHWYGLWGDCTSFDVEKEELRILPPPRLDPEDERATARMSFRLLSESRGHLYLVEVRDQSSSELSVYEMERDDSGWSPKHNVDLEPVAATFPEMIRTGYYVGDYAFRVIGVMREETEDETYILLHIPDKVVRYNFKDKTFKKLRDLKSSNGHENAEFFGLHGSFLFVPSLACV